MSSKSVDILLNRLYKIILCMLLIILFLLLAHTLRYALNKKQSSSTHDVGIKIIYNIEDYDDDDDDDERCQELTPPKKYFVYTSRCHMEYVDPFEIDAVSIFNPAKYRSCARGDDMVKVVYDNRTQLYRLELHGEASKPNTNITCCYQEIKRTFWYHSDSCYRLEHCNIFEPNFIVPNVIDAMLINCALDKVVFFELAYAFIHVKVVKTDPTFKYSNESKEENRKPNVLIFGIDSLSRINFRRNMPATHAYLRNKIWFELRGYNKVAADNFANQMALLTGNDEQEVNKICNPNQMGGLNKCTFAWDQYKQRNYHTAYAEDLAKFSTFNYNKAGFRTAPTDYYLRPMIVAIDEQFDNTVRNPKHYCIGRQLYAEYVFDYAQNFVTVYPTEPLFGLFWTSSFSRDAFDGATSMDDRILCYLRSLEAKGVMETSIVIFMSNHGMLNGPLRELSSGFLEERLPFFYISLPKWLQDEYPDFGTALEMNRNRLISQYDIHMTLQHILALSKPEVKLPQAQGCAKCQSIFRAVPENRTCADAGVNEHWCACELYRAVSVDNATVERITIMIIEKINDFIEGSSSRSRCSSLTINSINKVEVKENLAQPNSRTYRIQFTAYPRYSQFQVTVSYNLVTLQIALDMQQISRLNKFKFQMPCTDNKTIEHVCICGYMSL